MDQNDGTGALGSRGRPGRSCRWGPAREHGRFRRSWSRWCRRRLPVDALLELLAGLSEGPGELGQAGAAEEEEDDGEDDEELGCAEAFMRRGPFRGDPTRLPGLATMVSRPERRGGNSRSSSAVTANGTAPSPTMSVSTPSAAHPSACSRTCSTVPTRRPSRHSLERHRVEHARAVTRPESFEAPGEVALVLAAERVEPERPGDASRGRARLRRTPGRARPDARDRRRGSTPNTCSIRRPLPPPAASRRSPFPPTMIGGRGCCTAAGSFTRTGRAVERAVEGARSSPSRASRQDRDRLAQAVQPHPGRRECPSRSPRTRARTTPRRARRRADRRR